MNGAISISDHGMVGTIDGTLRSLVDYWCRVKGGRPAPCRADLDPAQLQALLPWVMLLDSLGDDYRYRLVGTGLDGLFGRRLTGGTVRTAWSSRLGDQWLLWMDAARCDSLPVTTSATTLSSARRPLRIDMVLLPLCSRGDRVDMLLCGVIGASPRRPNAPVLRDSGEQVTDDLVHFSGGFLTV